MAIKVLVVDDSALMRQLLTEIIGSHPDLEVVGAAPDAYVARSKIKALRPDVLTLDIEMPRMDGLSFLEKLMQLRPMPVVMVSSLTETNAEATIRALELGAVDCIAKPKGDLEEGMRGYSELIAEKIRAAAHARVRYSAAPAQGLRGLPARLENAEALRNRLIVIGASTGGTEAIESVLVAMPDDIPGILVVQHMPELFTKTFARRLDGLGRIRVKEAEQGDKVLPGHAYIAPGGHSHLRVARQGFGYVLALSQEPPVNRHRPSVDVLFHSAAASGGRNVIGVILTGMGGDGAAGMKQMKQAGAYNIAQDRASCVVFGMPKVAIEMGGVDKILPLSEIPGEIVQQLLLCAP